MSAAHKVALIGMGKMGHALAELAPVRGWTVVAQLDEAEMGETGRVKERLAGAQVAIEFTAPGAAPANVRAVVAAGCPIVVGTTGWNAELAKTADWVRERGGAMLTSANFSLGVNIFEHIVATAGRLLHQAPGFDAALVETHHTAKKDAPSGTALMLEMAVRRGWGREVPVTSIRTGSVPGTHEIIFDAPFEQIRLSHVARDRRVFAEGALIAAAWLIGRQGVYTMADVLGLSKEDK